MTPAQVAAARLRAKLDRADGVSTPDAVQRIAAAVSLDELPVEGHIEDLSAGAGPVPGSGQEDAGSGEGAVEESTTQDSAYDDAGVRFVEERDADKRFEQAMGRARRIFDVPENASVVIATPRLHHGGRRVMAEDDARAAEIVMSVFPQYKGLGLEQRAADKVTPPLKKSTLVLIGSERRNKITQQVLQHRATRALIDVRFEPSYEEHPSEATSRLIFQGEPLGDQEAALDERTEGRRADFGLLAKLPNPFNPQEAAFIFGGVHALGTLGAAEYLRRHIPDLEDDVGEDYFALVILAVRDDQDPDQVQSLLYHPPIRIPSPRAASPAST